MHLGGQRNIFQIVHGGMILSITFLYWKKGHVVTSQRAQSVRESDSFFRKRHIKTVFTNNVAEHAKSRMGNARTRPR